MAIPLDGRGAADRSPRRPRRPRGRPAAGPARRLLRATTRPGRCAPPATRPASASSSSRRPRSCFARPTSSTVSADRREAELLRLAAEPSAPEASAARRLGAARAAPEGGVELARRVGELLEFPLWQLSRRARPRRARGGDRRSRAAERALAGRRSRAALRGRGAGHRAAARPSSCSPAPTAPTGSTTTSSKWRAGRARDRRRRPDRGRRRRRARRSAAASPRPSARKLDGEISGRDEELAAALAAAAARRSAHRAMDWHESDGVRWLEAELPGARAAFSTRARRRQRGAFESLNLGVLTDDDRDAVVENRAPARRGARPRRPSGSRSGARSTAPRSQTHAAPQSPSPFAEPGSRDPRGRRPRHPRRRAEACAGARLRRRLPAGRARRARRRRRCCTAAGAGSPAGIVARGAEAVGATAAAIGPGIGALLLRGRRRGARGLRRPRAGDRRRVACSTSPRSPAACCERAGVGADRVAGPLHELRAGALLLPPPRRRRDRAPGGTRLDRGERLSGRG